MTQISESLKINTVSSLEAQWNVYSRYKLKKYQTDIFEEAKLYLLLNLGNLIYNNLYSGKSRQENLETASIVDFFDEQKAKLPRLHKIVKLLCCVPCSSMPIESLFSIISNKLTRKTNRLSDETLLNQLVTSFFYQFKHSVDQIL